MIKSSVFILALVTGILAVSVAVRAQESPDQTVPKSKHKKICITFDNLPAENYYDQEQRLLINEKLLSALSKHEVAATGFVVGDYIEGDWELIVDWLEAGHTLGFLTYSGQDIENVPRDVFMNDIKKGSDAVEDLLETYRQKGRYFRFPFLHYGGSFEYRDKINRILASQNIKVAHASIVVEDFVYNLSFEKNLPGHDSTRLELLKDEYIEHLIERLARAERLAGEIMGRPIRHILQLRANLLNAYYLDDVLAVFEKRGYNFITLEHALRDKVYRRDDKYNGSKSISFLERLKFSK